MFHEYNKFWPVRDRVPVRYSYQHDVTYQKTVLFTVTATTSNVTNIISFNIYQNDTTIKCKSLSQYKYFIPWKCCFIRQIPFLTRKIGLRDYHAICVCVGGGSCLSGPFHPLNLPVGVLRTLYVVTPLKPPPSHVTHFTLNFLQSAITWQKGRT